MKTLVLELKFLDGLGLEHLVTLEVEAESFTEAIGFVASVIEAYEDENDWDYVTTHLVELKGDDNGRC